MITIVDYGRGNLFSLSQALEKIGVAHQVSGDPDVVAGAGKLIVPGVGAFGDAMSNLREAGLVGPLKAAAERSVPMLGICVGCQMLLSRGEEFGTHDGLDIVPGAVTRIPAPIQGDDNQTRIPNVGWRTVSLHRAHPLFDGFGDEDYLYFVHSFAPSPDSADDTVATCRINQTDVTVAVAKGTVVGVQFHPEKSGAAGLRLLSNFAALSPVA